MNKMKQIRVGKVTLNLCIGKPGGKLNLAQELMGKISGATTVKTVAKKKIPTWDLRPGLEIGVKSMLRGDKAVELLKKLLKAKNNTLKKSCFDNTGNVNFGVSEYINIPGVKYNPKIGMLGLNVCVTLTRPGYRVKKRRIRPAKIGKNHRIKKQEAIDFMKNKFGVKVE